MLLARGAVEAIASLAPLATSPQAYFIPSHAALLYIGVPLVVVSSFLLFLSPGLFVVLALGIRGGITRWILTGFAASLVVFACVCTTVEAIHGSALRGVAFMVLQVACAFLAMAWVWMR
ncbi:MAG: hypothetical protein O7D35_12030, partial [Acidobacteria bacterium]|nr:hypothetical protein [Acidobacteriota bacterium]